MLDIGYLYYIIGLMIVTGMFMLILDVKRYKKDKMNKEHKFAKFLGWMYVVLASTLFLGNWVYQKWLW
ncbi:CLC_0170 family protein [Lederbergia lenta]|uniref:Uncharacterized protein n=1 Tax=Lederbergia lenta TaxID=1467 RepID=A0A2X4W8L8_LEDLE|nr:CLC_0170 family protein [Lederbergia lenta]MCM3109716.1 hypothetical protein [Lederbergia lenta]MEC2324533.1 hypothetical protein [Lederbergia lenta]SQI59511.1 Uncharacterised protein [Lederbergia lenta]